MPAPLTTQQIALYLSEQRAGSRQKVAAAAAGISVSSAHQIESRRLQNKAAKPSSRRHDPLAEVWEPLLLPLLEHLPSLTPTTLLEHLQEQKPDRDWSSLRRTLQHHVQQWKALHSPMTWTPEIEPVLMRASKAARFGQEKPHEEQAPQNLTDHPKAAHS